MKKYYVSINASIEVIQKAVTYCNYMGYELVFTDLYYLQGVEK